MNIAYDFSGLTLAQQWLLTYQGWTIESAGFGFFQPSKRTVKKLIERGLVVPHKRQSRGLTVTEYEVPLPVHIAWCFHCTESELA